MGKEVKTGAGATLACSITNIQTQGVSVSWSDGTSDVTDGVTQVIGQIVFPPPQSYLYDHICSAAFLR